MCHPSKAAHFGRDCTQDACFQHEDTEWLFDLQLDRFESNDDESCGDVFSSDNAEFELIEIDLSEFGLKPLEPRVGSGFFLLLTFKLSAPRCAYA